MKRVRTPRLCKGPAANKKRPITKRQRQVLDLLLLGYSNPRIARKLEISTDRAKHVVADVLARYGVTTRAALAGHMLKKLAMENLDLPRDSGADTIE